MAFPSRPGSRPESGAGRQVGALVYVALLRGVNVGGSNLVGMKELKAVFEAAGMTGVTTYIASGNVIFSTRSRARAPLVRRLEQAITRRFGFPVSLVLRDVADLRTIVKAMPARWTNDATMKCDVLFLWDDVDQPSIVTRLSVRSAIEDVRYAPGAVIWRVDRRNAARSGLIRLAGTPLYRRMTVRNCNTTRKLLELMEGYARRPTGPGLTASRRPSRIPPGRR